MPRPAFYRRFVSIGRDMVVDVRVLDGDCYWISTLLFPMVDVLVGVLGWSCGSGLSLRLDQRRQRLRERLACLRQHDSILWAVGSGETGFDCCKIETQQLGVFRFGRIGVVKKSLLAGVRFDQRDLLVTAAGEFQVAQALFVNREDAAGGSILGCHVGDGSAIGEWQVLQPGAKVLDKLAVQPRLAPSLVAVKAKGSCAGPYPQPSA